MERDLKKVFHEAFELPDADRAAFSELLLESLEPPPDPDAEELWAEEEERR